MADPQWKLVKDDKSHWHYERVVVADNEMATECAPDVPTHVDVLNFMIANKCGVIDDGPDDDVTIVFNLHCVEVTVKARFVGRWETNDVRYEIVSWTSKVI